MELGVTEEGQHPSWGNCLQMQVLLAPSSGSSAPHLLHPRWTDPRVGFLVLRRPTKPSSLDTQPRLPGGTG